MFYKIIVYTRLGRLDFILFNCYYNLDDGRANLVSHKKLTPHLRGTSNDDQGPKKINTGATRRQEEDWLDLYNVALESSK